MPGPPPQLLSDPYNTELLQPLPASDGPTGGIADVLLLGRAHPGPVVFLGVLFMSEKRV